MEKYAVLMAGGTGSRLWLISREKKPKQFLSVDGDQCMLIQTLERIRPVVPPENCFLITNQNLKDITQKTLEGRIPLSNILTEPLRKNTAACISYSVSVLKRKIKEGVLCFFPADGYVRDRAAYRAAVERAYKTAESAGGLVIIGVAPSSPATGFGYICVSREQEGEVSPVKKFVEKPDSVTAKGFLASGNYWWNSGIVAGSLDAFDAHIKLLLPDHYKAFSTEPDDSVGQDSSLSVKKAYADLPDISFDKGVLERSTDILAVRGNFDWDDVGNLESLSVALSPDAEGNKTSGKFMGIGVTDSTVYAGSMLVAAIGIDHVVVAVTDNAVLICSKDRVQDVKLLVDLLKTGDYKNYT